MNIILIGFKNVGKTTTGQHLAEKLDFPFFDTDVLLLNLYNHVNGGNSSLVEIYKKEKEQGFRAWEQNAIESLQEVENAVIATGGGSILSEENIRIFKNKGKIVYLKAAAAELLKRQENNGIPAFINKTDPINDFLKIYHDREPIYARIADHIVNVENKDDFDILTEIIEGIINQ